MKRLRPLLIAFFFLPAYVGAGAEIVSKPDTPGYVVVLDPEEQLTQMYLSFYLNEARRPHVLEALERSDRYRALILQVLKEEGLPRELLYLPMIESEYNPSAVSPAGAVGLWQLMPHTARLLGLSVTPTLDERLDPEKSTRAALRHLKSLRARFGNWPLALAAYNCGGARLRTIMARGRRLPRETRHFVPKFRAAVLVGEVHMARRLNPNGQEPSEAVELPKMSGLDIAMLSRDAASEVLLNLSPALQARSFHVGELVGPVKQAQDGLESRKNRLANEPQVR